MRTASSRQDRADVGDEVHKWNWQWQNRRAPGTALLLWNKELSRLFPSGLLNRDVPLHTPGHGKGPMETFLSCASPTD